MGGPPVGRAGVRHSLGCPPPAVLCFALTRSLLLTCLVPAGLLGLRYYYSRKVVLAYLDCALHTDMADIEQYYMKPPGEPSTPAPSCPLPLLLLPSSSSSCWGAALIPSTSDRQAPEGRDEGGWPGLGGPRLLHPWDEPLESGRALAAGWGCSRRAGRGKCRQS